MLTNYGKTTKCGFKNILDVKVARQFEACD